MPNMISEDMRQGLIMGLAMQPLVIAGIPPTSQLPKPVIELLFDNSLQNTGTGNYTVALAKDSAAIQYAEGRNGGRCFAATNKCGITITDVSQLLLSDFTITFWCKISDNVLSPYYQYRRFVGWSANGAYRGCEVGYTSSGTTTNIPSVVCTGGREGASAQTPINDGNWHSVVIVQRGTNITTTIDQLEPITWYSCSLSDPKTYLALSDVKYALNGYIANFRVFDKALGYAEQEGILAL